MSGRRFVQQARWLSPGSVPWHAAVVLVLTGCPQELPPSDAFGPPPVYDMAQGDTALAGPDAGEDAAPVDGGKADTSGQDTAGQDTAGQDAAIVVSDGVVLDVPGSDAAPDSVAPIDVPGPDLTSGDAFGKACNSAQDCGPAPSACTSWQCTGVCYPLLANGTACDDGDPCTTGDVCFVGNCQKGQAKNCDDGNPCTQDGCGSGGACTHPPLADGSPCGGGKSCAGGKCVGGVGDGVVSVTAGGDQTCAIAKGTAGKVFCWGDDEFAQAGSAKTSGKWYTKPEPVAGLPAASQIDCGGNHCCAITSGGLFCWGDDQFGQSSGKGDGQKPGVLVKAPVAVAVPASQIAVGEFHSCALDNGGIVRCWGLGSSGQLGNGTNDVGSPPVIVQLKWPASAIDCGHTHCCALAGGVPYCWGLNMYGQIGTSTTAEQKLPVAAKGVTGATQLTLGQDHTCALIGGGKVMCWGENSSHQTGVSGSGQILTPSAVDGLAGASQLAAGGDHTCALVNTELYCWGGNNFGQSLPKSKAFLVEEPTSAGMSGAVQMALGGGHTCVRVQAGGVWCWGNNNRGQVGDGTTKTVTTPTQIQ